MIVPQLQSTYYVCLMYKSYEGRKAFLGYDSLANRKNVRSKLAYDIPKRNLSTSYVSIVTS